MIKYRILVLADDGAWNVFSAGFCDTEALAQEQVGYFQLSHPTRTFAIRKCGPGQ